MLALALALALLGGCASAVPTAAPTTPADAAGAFKRLTIVVGEPSLNVTAGVVSRIVAQRTEAACAVTIAALPPVPPTAATTLLLTLSIDSTLGQEAYAAAFDGRTHTNSPPLRAISRSFPRGLLITEHTATIKGGDHMAVNFGAGNSAGNERWVLVEMWRNVHLTFFLLA